MGSKKHWAPTVWRRLGQPDIYAEPFAGSVALLTRRPYPYGKKEIIIDVDGFICNFWRAVRYDPEKIIDCMESRLNIEHDVLAAGPELSDWMNTANAKLRDDLYWYDARMAGLWCWATTNTIRNRTGYKHVHLRYSPRDTPERADIRGYFTRLHERFQYVQVMNTDWSAIKRPSVLNDYTGNTMSVGVAVDPPYITTKNKKYYAENDAAQQSLEWAVANGDRYRIVYFANVGDFDAPPGWDVVRMKRSPTFGGHQDDDVAFFSPACPPPAQPSLFA